MNLTMFFELDDAGSPVLDEHEQSVIRHRPESKSLADVLLVTRLHAANPAMHHVIHKFIELYAITLQWEWFAQYQLWLARKEDAELNAPALPIEKDQQVLESPLFAEPEPVRPELKTIEQYRAEILIDGISIDEYLFRTQRSAAVNSITVEVDGLVFDGDEQSQRRLLSAIQAGTDQGMTKTIWRLHNNDEHVVTIDQLKEAHAKAILAQGELWMRKG